MKSKMTPRKKIHMRIRKKIIGSSERPRLAVYRSNKNIYCQLIDDSNGHTMAASTSAELKKGNKTEIAKAVGLDIADKAKALSVENVVFDRAGYLYHGRVKALAEGAREGGLVF